MTIYKLKQVKVITVEPKSEIEALFEVLEKIEEIQFRMQHIVLVYECNLSVWNIYSEVNNKLSDLKVVT
jgi:heterodisulfide reductase subunit B